MRPPQLKDVVPIRGLGWPVAELGLAGGRMRPPLRNSWDRH